MPPPPLHVIKICVPKILDPENKNAGIQNAPRVQGRWASMYKKRAGGGGGSLGDCVPKIAEINISFCKFHFLPP